MIMFSRPRMFNKNARRTFFSRLQGETASEKQGFLYGWLTTSTSTSDAQIYNSESLALVGAKVEHNHVMPYKSQLKLRPNSIKVVEFGNFELSCVACEDRRALPYHRNFLYS